MSLRDEMQTAMEALALKLNLNDREIRRLAAENETMSEEYHMYAAALNPKNTAPAQVEKPDAL